MALKDFLSIERDYAFFMSHATEAEHDLAAFSRDLAAWRAPEDAIRMLDFGCGMGEFTQRFLASMSWPPKQLELTLVEPVRQHGEQAVIRLQPFTDRSITRFESLSGSIDRRFDLVL